MKKPILFVLMSVMGSLFFSCKKDEKSSTMSDDVFYKEIAYCLAKCYSDVFNQNLAGKPAGVQNISTTGPMGGSILITGNSSQDLTYNVTSLDLLYTMDGVKYSTTHANITQSGAVTYKGSFSPSTNNISHLSDNLVLTGTVTVDGKTRNVNLTTPVSINVTKSTVSATINGKNVNW